MGHIVTFHFHSFKVNQDYSLYTVLMKQRHIIILDMCEINVGKKINTLNPKGIYTN